MAQLIGNKYLNVTSWSKPVPCDQLDEVVVEGDTGASVKDGGVAVAVEVCGHNLRGGEEGKRLVKEQDPQA